MGQWADVNPGKPALADTSSMSLIAGRIDNLVDGLDGTSYLSAIDINGGSIDDTPIGVTTPDSGAFTTLSASSTLAVTGATTLASTLGVTGNVAVNTNKFNVTAASGNTAIAGTLAVTGAATLSSTLGVTGDVAVNTNKFTVAASSGNLKTLGQIEIATDIYVNTNKFVVDGVSGNTTVAGVLNVAGVSTLTGGVSGDLAVTGGVSTDGKETLKFDVISGSATDFSAGTLTIAHGKGANIRGVSAPYAAGSYTPATTPTYADSTNVYISYSSINTTLYVVVYYV